MNLPSVQNYNSSTLSLQKKQNINFGFKPNSLSRFANKHRFITEISILSFTYLVPSVAFFSFLRYEVNHNSPQEKASIELTDSLINKRGILKGIGISKINPLGHDTLQLSSGIKAIINPKNAEIILKLPK